MRRSRLVCILALALLLAGCWDRREVNDLALVMGSAIDKEDEQYRITLQIALPGQMRAAGGGSAEGGSGTPGGHAWYVDAVTGQSIRQANTRQQQAFPRQLNFAHRRVVLFGEAAAREGVESLMDLLARVPQNRMTALIFVTEGPAAGVLNANAPIEQFPAEIIRELATSAVQAPASLTTFVDAILSDGREPTTLAFRSRQTVPGPGAQPVKSIQWAGVAIFRENRLVAIMPPEEALGVLLATGQAKSPAVTFPLPKGEGLISVRLNEVSGGLEPRLVGGKPAAHILVKVRGSLVENPSEYVTTVDGNLLNLQDVVSQHLEGVIKKSVKTLQDLGSDTLGIGGAFRRKMPRVWKTVHSRWAELYPKVPVTVEVRTIIEHAGSAIAPMGQPRGELKR